jgi:hypothetical protein
MGELPPYGGRINGQRDELKMRDRELDYTCVVAKRLSTDRGASVGEGRCPERNRKTAKRAAQPSA